MLKVGLDIHGVIDLYSEEFKNFSSNLVRAGHEVSIITGQEWKKVKPTVDKYGISYTHYFSIVDYHKKIKDTKMWQDEKQTWWMDGRVWVKTKGDYIKREGINVHFDDNYEYAEFVPNTCTFVLVPRKGFDKFTRAMFRYVELMN